MDSEASCNLRGNLHVCHKKKIIEGHYTSERIEVFSCEKLLAHLHSLPKKQEIQRHQFITLRPWHMWNIILSFFPEIAHICKLLGFAFQVYFTKLYLCGTSTFYILSFFLNRKITYRFNLYTVDGWCYASCW